MLVMHAIL